MMVRKNKGIQGEHYFRCRQSLCIVQLEASRPWSYQNIPISELQRIPTAVKIIRLWKIIKCSILFRALLINGKKLKESRNSTCFSVGRIYV